MSLRILIGCAVCALGAAPGWAEWLPAPGTVDPKVRIAPYSSEQVYQLYGYVGYEIDIEFAPGERFVGLAAGDMNALAFKADGNHLFLKPKVARVSTNLTVLTSAHQYEFDYSVLPGPPEATTGEVIYALRFTYPPRPRTAVVSQRQIASALAQGPIGGPRNDDYWYCGSPELKPLAAWDDGVRTWIRFGARQELPAIFVKNGDGSESLVNFSVSGGDVVVQRVARRFVLRRGHLTGCIVNKDFNGGGERLKTGTVSSRVEREVRRPKPSEGTAP